MTARRPTSFLLLAATTLILEFFGRATALCLPQYRSTSGGVVHTACKQRSARCAVVKSGLSAEDKQILLDTHNNYRSQLAKGQLGRFPPAKDMLRLMWDDEMANNAQALAELCESTHDKLEERFTTKFQQTGQNIGWSKDPLERTDVQASTWVDSWVEEYKDYAGSVSSFQPTRGSGVVTHFVQIAWARTTSVGCGYVQHRLPPGGFKYETIVICNYGEWGNQIGRPIYLEGAPCSQCPSGSTCDQSSGLCVSSEDTGGVGGGGRRPVGGGSRRPGGGGGRQPGGGERPRPCSGVPPVDEGGGSRDEVPSGGGRGGRGRQDDTREGHAGEVYEKGSIAGISYADIFWTALGFVIGAVAGASTVVAICRDRAMKSGAGVGTGATGDGQESGFTSRVSSMVP